MAAASAVLWLHACSQLYRYLTSKDAACVQVHIDIFADGPTRVVRFTDSGEDLGLEDGIIAEWRRVRHLEQQLSVANQRFVALRGGGGISRIDLFGSAVPREPVTETSVGPSGSTAALPPPPEGPRTLSVAASGRLRQRSLASGAPVVAPAAAVVIMIAGDLTVSVVNASGAHGNLVVRLRAEDQEERTTVLWNSSDPSWNEPFTFSKVRLAAPMTAHMRMLPAQLAKLCRPTVVDWACVCRCAQHRR